MAANNNAGGQPSGQATLLWEADCDTRQAGTAVCAAILASLEKASRSVAAAVSLKKDLLFKLSAAAAPAGSSSASPGPSGSDVLAETAVPVKLALPAPNGVGTRLVPQALGKQYTDLGNEAGKWDAIIGVNVPSDGFHFDVGSGNKGKPSFDAVLMHEILHALGLSTDFGAFIGGSYLTPKPLTNGTAFVSFSPLGVFDASLVDASTGRPLLATWESTAPAFRPANAVDWINDFAKSPAAQAAKDLYAAATTADRIAFKTSNGTLVNLDTTYKKFTNGRSLSHISSASNTAAADIFLYANAVSGPLPEAVFGNTTSGDKIMVLSPAISGMLKTIGWTLCSENPDACSKTPSVSSAAAATTPSQQQPFPTWAIGVIAIVGVLTLALGIFGFIQLRKRKAAHKQPAMLEVDEKGLIRPPANTPLEDTSQPIVEPEITKPPRAAQSLPSATDDRHSSSMTLVVSRSGSTGSSGMLGSDSPPMSPVSRGRSAGSIPTMDYTIVGTIPMEEVVAMDNWNVRTRVRSAPRMMNGANTLPKTTRVPRAGSGEAMAIVLPRAVSSGTVNENWNTRTRTQSAPRAMTVEEGQVRRGVSSSLVPTTEHELISVPAFDDGVTRAQSSPLRAETSWSVRARTQSAPRVCNNEPSTPVETTRARSGTIAAPVSFEASPLRTETSWSARARTQSAPRVCNLDEPPVPVETSRARSGNITASPPQPTTRPIAISRRPQITWDEHKRTQSAPKPCTTEPAQMNRGVSYTSLAPTEHEMAYHAQFEAVGGWHLRQDYRHIVQEDDLEALELPTPPLNHMPSSEVLANVLEGYLPEDD